MKKLSIILACLGVLIVFRGLSFAITYFENLPLNEEQEGVSSSIETESLSGEPLSLPAGHAPEPSTLILFLSGIAGLAVRFIRKSYDKFKRYSDLLLAILGLMLAAPILTFAAILIKLTSKGPILYKQSRVGKGGEVFRIFKLRTMRVDAEQGTGAVWAKKNDPRIISVGKLLRKLHIDEIPQLFNVIKGEMSVVGPRPERPEMVRDFKHLILDYEKRLAVKPGITGLAQVWYKYDETIQDVRRKIKYDLLYIKKVCLWVDLRVMFQTVIVVFTGKGAQ